MPCGGCFIIFSNSCQVSQAEGTFIVFESQHRHRPLAQVSQCSACASQHDLLLFRMPLLLLLAFLHSESITLSLSLCVILHFFPPTIFQFVAKCIFVKLKPVSGEKGIQELQPFAPGVPDVSLLAPSKLKVCVKKLNLNNLFLESFGQLYCESLNHGLHTSSFPKIVLSPHKI